MHLDFHAHCNSDDKDLVKAYVENCEKNETIAALSGGLRYGGHDFVPNEGVIEICRQYPHNLVPLAKIDLWDTAPDVSELRRYVDMGVKGFKFIYPYYEYDHDLYMPVYEECEKLGVPVLFHTGDYRPNEADILYRRPVLKNMAPINLDRIARSFQKLHIVMAHMGTSYFREIAACLVKTHANLYFDLAGSGAFYGVSPEQAGRLLKAWIYTSDPATHFKKMVFGSDSYIKIPVIQTQAFAAYRNILFMNSISKEMQEQILGGTVMSWMGIQSN